LVKQVICQHFQSASFYSEYGMNWPKSFTVCSRKGKRRYIDVNAEDILAQAKHLFASISNNYTMSDKKEPTYFCL